MLQVRRPAFTELTMLSRFEAKVSLMLNYIDGYVIKIFQLVSVISMEA
ncbi:hypothetical protein [Pedobacter frigoris]|nr:hypothetical protein [Pedobacter frigoris]